MFRIKSIRFAFKYLNISILLLAFVEAGATGPEVKFEPPFWFSNMAQDTFSVLVYGENIAEQSFKMEQNDHVELIRIHKMPSGNHLWLVLKLDRNVGETSIDFILGKRHKLKYEIRNRQAQNSPEITSSDNVYRIMPDRFCNGDLSNDNIEGYADSIHMELTKGRHGGDLAGIQSKLDYLTELGVTALLINPLLENNQKKGSYHGYACTDFYRIDPRFGSNDEYVSFVEACNFRSMAVLKDVVFNHIGSEHKWMSDVPDSNWIHWFDEFTPSNYRAVALSDPHASKHDKAKLSTGWFVPTMPDLNQDDPRLACYLIQNTLWWMEVAQLSGFRVDTYAYPSTAFMRRLTRSVKRNFPNSYIYGEIWERGLTPQIWFGSNPLIRDSALDGMTDYNLYFAMQKWWHEEESWHTGLGRLYYSLASDVFCDNPNALLTFVDNHDQDRFFGQINEDFATWKQGIGFILTMRGIPCIYYGTELLWTEAGDHGGLRKDFPGGWPSDSVNKFNREGRSLLQNYAYDYLRTLFHYRRNNPDVFESDLLHFVPQDGVYAYFRKGKEKTLMVLISNAKDEVKVEKSRFAEILPEEAKLTNILSGVKHIPSDHISIKGKDILMFEF
jgi:glycosidase